jgi:hypothetical protein
MRRLRRKNMPGSLPQSLPALQRPLLHYGLTRYSTLAKPTASNQATRLFISFGPSADELGLAFRYLRPGHPLAIEVQRFELAEVLQALVDEARMTARG